jgi:hypothetical protein
LEKERSSNGKKLERKGESLEADRETSFSLFIVKFKIQSESLETFYSWLGGRIDAGSFF